MPKITDAPVVAWTVTGSPERLLDRAPDGTLWWAQNENHGGGDGDVYYWYSKDEGNTWSISSSDHIHIVPSYFARASHIDSDGYMFVGGRYSNTRVKVWRGRPKSSKTAWDFDEFDPLDWSVASEALAVEGGFDLVAFRVGSGWRVFVLFTTINAAGTTYTLRMSRVDVSSSGTLSLHSSYVLRTSTGYGYPYGCLAFQHTGDGKTATSTPHVYVVSSINTPNTAQYRQDDLLLTKFTYESGSWTQGSPVTLEAGVDTTNRVMRCSYDGTRVVTVYGTCNRTTGVASAAIHAAEWVESTGVVSLFNPAAYGGQYAVGVSSAVDPVGDDVYVAAHGTASALPVWTKYTRASSTWSAWATFGSSLAGWTTSGRISMKQYVQSSAIELVYATGSVTPWQAYYAKIAVTNQTPSVPVLVSPAPSSVADLGTLGAVFSWQFVDPDPGDVQGAWQMRRRIGAGAYSYYTSATQTWGGSAVWNTGPDQSWSFGPGVWTNGSVWSWSVNTRDAAGLSSGFASDISVTATVAPTVTVGQPAGIWSADSSPIVAWTYASSSAQRTYQIKVYDIATYTGGGFDPATTSPTWDSGDTASVLARSARIGATLLNGQAYRAYMRVSDALGVYSGWSYGEFLLSLQPAPAPLVGVVADTDYVTGLGRVRLTVQGLANMLSESQAYRHTTNSTDWVNDANCAMGTSSAQGVVGGITALTMTATSAATMRLVSNDGVAPITTDGSTPPAPRDFPALPGQTYTAIASFTAATVVRGCRLNLRWYDSADVLLATTSGTPVANVVNFPTLMSTTGVAPLGADRVRLVLEVQDPASAELHYVDGIDLHPGSSLTYSPGGLTGQQTFTASRTLPDGTTTTIRFADQTSGDQHQRLTIYDREMPFATPVTYTVQSIIQLTTGQTLASDPSPAALAQVDNDVWGIRDPRDPAGEARALVIDHDESREALTTVYRPAGRTLPVVESQGSTGDDGKFTVWVDTVTTRRVMRELLNRQTELLLQSPSGDSWYVWVQSQNPKGDAGQAQTIDVDYVQVEAP